jgi:hypothetical protein
MQISFMFPRFLVAIVVVSLLGFPHARAQSQQSQRYQPAGLNAPPPQQPDLFEVSLGFNYIYLNDQFPETKNLYGLETSAFINATSWLAAGGEFMADFGSHSVQVFRNTVNVDSERIIYVFGPRVTVWQNPRFRIFAEALAGGVHANAKLTAARSFFGFSRTASADGFAAALGAGVDWRLTNHLSWRVAQADYLGTDLSSHWQTDFRASTSIVYAFGRR